MFALGTISNSVLRNIVIGLVICGVGAGISIPLALNVSGKELKQVNPNLPKSGFSLKKNKEDTDWNFEFKTPFNSERGGRAQVKSFNDVKMAFGDHVLGSNDLLISPGHSGKYYLAKGRGNKGWELPDGTVKWRFHKSDVEGKDFKYIRLDWTKSQGLSFSTIAVGSCSFTRIGVGNQDTNYKIKMTCWDSIAASKNKKSWEPSVTTTLSSSEFKNFFGQK